MSKFKGKIQRTDIEGGHWLLRTDQGVMYQLKNAPNALLVDGMHVEIEGIIANSTFGIAMMGEVLEVHNYREIEE